MASKRNLGEIVTTRNTHTKTQKTLEEKLAEITAKHGKDYVITWENHPKIMQEWTQQIVDKLDVESAEIKAKGLA